MITQRMLFNLEKELLLASGIKDRDKLVEYRGNLEQLTKQFIGEIKPSHESMEMEKIKFLKKFDGRWTAKR